MEAIKYIPYIVLLLAITGVIAGSTMIATDSLGGTLTQCKNATHNYNITLSNCCQTAARCGSTFNESSNATNAYQAILNGEEGVGDVANQMPTVGVIAVMIIIISLVAGVFIYMRYFQ